MIDSGKKIIAIIGPTASGKSALVDTLAQQFPIEVIGCDSVQIYRGFDIGSAKPSVKDRQKLPHHLMDIRDAHQPYSAAEYRIDARQAIEGTISRGRIPIIVGGTGLYLRALFSERFSADLPHDKAVRRELEEFSNIQLHEMLHSAAPKRASQIHVNDRVRLLRANELLKLAPNRFNEFFNSPINAPSELRRQTFVIKLDPLRKSLHLKISARTQQMLDQGLIEEVRGLMKHGDMRDSKPMQAIGYRQVAQFLRGEIDEKDLHPKICAATRQYAKRQCTWWRDFDADLIRECGQSVPSPLNF